MLTIYQRSASQYGAKVSSVGQSLLVNQKQRCASLIVPHQPALLDRLALRNDWRLLAYRENLDSILAQYKVTRPQAYRQFNEGVSALKPERVCDLFEAISNQQLDFEMTLFSLGVACHYANKKQDFAVQPGLVKAQSTNHSLFITTRAIDSLWLITKTFADGIELMIEAFDRYHRPVLFLSPAAKQQRGFGQLSSWLEALKDGYAAVQCA
ncbi:hypothetical protein JX580_11020 [Thiomicrospira microaerophila]|uniref:hypothetical protein n=1 Tax=Thiomicrospira microaerophila TaxID=406020 RepID=UPI00200FCCFC|nr:hypothetical protein [Thiomicrospira microaerophila]UQB42171.1 hypothetical protein JX580_11020 [Thiomicrospira microaerophila]